MYQVILERPMNYFNHIKSFLFLVSGETILINRDDFGFMDEDDNDEDLRITLMASPVNGQLVYKQINVVMAGNIITQQDINNNYIR